MPRHRGVQQQPEVDDAAGQHKQQYASCRRRRSVNSNK
jgi:hypothetical protein